MTRARGQRGAALAWAMLLLAIVSTTCAISGSLIARRVRVDRLARESAELDDLRASALAVAKVRAARAPGWRGPETVEVGAGVAVVRVECDGERVSWRVESTLRGGRRAVSVVPAVGVAPCVPGA